MRLRGPEDSCIQGGDHAPANLCCVAATFLFWLATTGTAQELVLNKVEFGHYTAAGLDQLAAGAARMFVSGQSFVVSVSAASNGVLNLWHLDQRVRKVRSVNLRAGETTNTYYTIPRVAISRGYLISEFVPPSSPGLDRDDMELWARSELADCDADSIAFREGSIRGNRLAGWAFFQGDYLIGDKSQISNDDLIRFYAKSRWYSGQTLMSQGRHLQALAAFDEARRALRDCKPFGRFSESLTRGCDDGQHDSRDSCS